MGDIVKTIRLSDEVVIPTPRIPDPLDDFSATENSPNIDLGWVDNDSTAAFYDIEHSTDNFSTIANQVTIPAVPLTGGVYEFEGLNLAITNYFRIKARNATGSSAWVTATTT